MQILENVKDSVMKNKLVVSLVTTGTILATPLISHASEATTVDFITPITTAAQSTVTNTVSCFAAIIPIGLTIFTAKFVWMKSVQFFSKLAAKN